MSEQDFNNRLKELYLPPQKQFTLIDVPPVNYIVVEGAGGPETAAYTEAVKWLFFVVHVIKPYVREKMGKNFVEPPLECLWWADDMGALARGEKEQWKWRVMIVMTELVSPARIADAIATVEKKRGKAPSSLRLEKLHEGRSVQIMHIGDYGGIAAVCETMYQDFIPQNKLVPVGPYHEIYLNDPARVAPEKRKIVLRQPVVNAC